MVSGSKTPEPVGIYGLDFNRLYPEGVPQYSIDINQTLDSLCTTVTTGTHLAPLFPLEIWNVYETTMRNTARANNAVEGGHGGFQKLVKRSHPAMYKFIKIFQRGHTFQCLTIELSLTAIRSTSRNIQKKSERKDPDVEEALYQWFFIVSGKGVNINGTILKAKSEKLDKNDAASILKQLIGSADNESVEKWKTTKIHTFLENFYAHDIYNADETGLYYRATPDGSFWYTHIPLSGYKKAMDRITVLCCTDMSGNDENDDILPVHIIDYEEFSTIDNNLPSYDNNEDCEDLIVEGIKSKHEKFEQDDDESPVPMTNQEAKKCMAVLQRYFMEEGKERVLHPH
ncbi:hypothetical protein RF11_01387 [Thelohanellus kitauei]|uniref:DDE-1 domain-containing protein n=1 Tax=Thelohanellus kitauei TaxID=669202 RepID=A0A0C2NCZ5_THEKT|nr:hypothetical protein RF11_01387 [Thelohanellus kitauei]